MGVPRYRIPSLRKRYVVRARYLRSHPPFGAAIGQARAGWDAEFPEFAIGEPSIPPEKPPITPSTEPVPPARLLAELWAHQERIKDGTWDHARGARRHNGFWRWRQLLKELCLTWWPPEYYPVLSRWDDHPARRFVAACLTYRMEWVDEDWIARHVLDAIPLPGPPGDICVGEDSPEVVKWREQFDFAIQRLWEAASRGERITTEVVESVAVDARKEGQTAWQRRRDEIWSRTPAMPPYVGAYLYFPVFPRMTHDDWDQAKPRVLDSMRAYYGENPLADDARRLRAEGTSVKAIAGLLGVSRPTVDHWLKNLPPDR